MTATRKAFKYRFYPTPEQKELLAKTFGCVRVVWNHILHYRSDAYETRQEKVSFLGANARLTELKKQPEFEWLNEVSSVPLQQCLRHQQTAFKNFFEGRAKYPRFKNRKNRQSAEFTKSAFKYREGKLYIAKCKEPLNIKWSRELSSEPSTITISKDWAGRYFVSCLCEFKPVKLPTNDNAIGLDLGLIDLFVTSDGEKTGNPKHTAKYAEKLAKYQRRLSKKQLGSSNRAKAKFKVARVHAKISDCRRDQLHKFSRRLINENQVVCVETLRVSNMLRNRCLSKSIADAGWGEFVRQLEYKGDWAGRQVVAIDQWFPSTKACSACGCISEKIPLDIRSWHCAECGAEHDRDVNAAVNIKAAGLAVLACGENVNPVLASAGIGCSQ